MSTESEIFNAAGIVKLRAEAAEKAIHRIEDFLEYRYLSMPREGVQKIIMSYIDDYAKELSKSIKEAP